jgi:hypothetical protein
MLNKDKKNYLSDDNISDKLENIINKLNKNNDVKINNLRIAFNNEVEKIYLPTIKKFKKQLEKYNIISEIERNGDKVAEILEFRIFTEIEKYQEEEENDSEEYEGTYVAFEIICYFNNYDYNGEKVDKPISIEDSSGYKSSDPNHIPIKESYNLNELSQEIINEKLLEYFEEIKITKTTIKII